jgi:hypothetical protein
LAERDAGFTLLLEHACPGDTLLHSGLSEEMLVELGGLARRLHAAGTPPPAILPMSACAASWPPTAELAEMLIPSPADVLVHLDLHPGNALRANGGWKALDPHGARADRHAEIWALICPEAPALPDDPVDAKRSARHRLELYSEAAGLDADRAAAWTRARERRGRVPRRRWRPRLGGAPAPDREGAQSGLTPNGGPGRVADGLALTTGQGKRDDWRRHGFTCVRELLRHRRGTAHRERRRA